MFIVIRVHCQPEGLKSVVPLHKDARLALVLLLGGGMYKPILQSVVSKHLLVKRLKALDFFTYLAEVLNDMQDKKFKKYLLASIKEKGGTYGDED